MRMTRHAQERAQQRGIPPMLVDLLEMFGCREPAGGGATKAFFDKAARRRVKAYAGPLASLIEEHLNVYAVFSADNHVITTAYRLERIRRH